MSNEYLMSFSKKKEILDFNVPVNLVMIKIFDIHESSKMLPFGDDKL